MILLQGEEQAGKFNSRRFYQSLSINDSVNSAFSWDAVTGGEFGELLGGLAPQELIKRPRLIEFARHVKHVLTLFYNMFKNMLRSCQ